MKARTFVNLTPDERARLGRDIGGRLVGVTEKEWARWTAYVAQNGLPRAAALARTMVASPSVHPGVKQTYREALRVLRKWPVLKRLPAEDLVEVLHHARMALVARRAAAWEEDC
jgi:hypothetical protein